MSEQDKIKSYQAGRLSGKGEHAIAKLADNRKTRESGFYWCRYLGVWKICEWESSGQWWNIPGFDNNTIFEDQNFAEIDERRIVREEPKKPNYTGFSGNTERIPQNE